MIQGIDLNQIKQYNTSLKAYRDKAANINAQIEYANKELDSLCRELSAELGQEVNSTNVEQIYKEQTEKINSALQSGNIVLAKIASEEAALTSGATAVSQGANAGINAGGSVGASTGAGMGAGISVGPVLPIPPVESGQQPLFDSTKQMETMQPFFQLG